MVYHLLWYMQWVCVQECVGTKPRYTWSNKEGIVHATHALWRDMSQYQLEMSMSYIALELLMIGVHLWLMHM